jgi:hypothetical protein
MDNWIGGHQDIWLLHHCLILVLWWYIICI